MKLGLEISFDQFLVELQIDETTCLITLQCTLQKPTLFFKQKPNDIPTNVFNIHIGPLWEANVDANIAPQGHWWLWILKSMIT